MEMTLRQLRTLREVEARGSIASAADALGYTPSAVSQQLSTLEKAAGVGLIERVGRGIRLTDAGIELVRHAQDVLVRVEEAQAAVEEVVSEPRGTVRVGLFSSVAMGVMPGVLRLLRDRHPDLVVRTVNLDPDLAIETLAGGGLDLALILDYPHAPSPRPRGVARRLVLREPFRLVVAADEPDERLAGPVVDLADLADRAFVAEPPSTNCGRHVLQACRDSGFEPEVTHEFLEYPAALRLVGAGAGIGLVPDLGLIDAPPTIRTLDLAQPLFRHIEVAFRETSERRPAVRAVLDALDEVVASLDPAEPIAG